MKAVSGVRKLENALRSHQNAPNLDLLKAAEEMAAERRKLRQLQEADYLEFLADLIATLILESSASNSDNHLASPNADVDVSENGQPIVDKPSPPSRNNPVFVGRQQQVIDEQIKQFMGSRVAQAQQDWGNRAITEDQKCLYVEFIQTNLQNPPEERRHIFEEHQDLLSPELVQFLKSEAVRHRQIGKNHVADWLEMQAELTTAMVLTNTPSKNDNLPFPPSEQQNLAYMQVVEDLLACDRDQ